MEWLCRKKEAVLLGQPLIYDLVILVRVDFFTGVPLISGNILDKPDGAFVKSFGLVEVANVAAVADDFEPGVKMTFYQF